MHNGALRNEREKIHFMTSGRSDTLRQLGTLLLAELYLPASRYSAMDSPGEERGDLAGKSYLITR